MVMATPIRSERNRFSKSFSTRVRTQHKKRAAFRQPFFFAFAAD
jgi:hypothetical protein